MSIYGVGASGSLMTGYYGTKKVEKKTGNTSSIGEFSESVQGYLDYKPFWEKLTS